MPARAVLDELLRVGAVRRRTTGRIEPVRALRAGERGDRQVATWAPTVPT